MKKELKGLIIGIILTLTVSAVADTVWQQIDVQVNGINIEVNGSKLNADNFVYNDTTYVPLRAIFEALGREVDYDADKNTAYVNDKKDEDNLNNTYAPNPDSTYGTVDEFGTKITVDGIYAIPFSDGDFVDTAQIYRKYPGDYAFNYKDGSFEIGWGNTVYFESYPNHGGEPEFEWYHTTFLPWVLEFTGQGE